MIFFVLQYVFKTKVLIKSKLVYKIVSVSCLLLLITEYFGGDES